MLKLASNMPQVRIPCYSLRARPGAEFDHHAARAVTRQQLHFDSDPLCINRLMSFVQYVKAGLVDLSSDQYLVLELAVEGAAA